MNATQTQARINTPTFEIERSLWAQGFRYIAGVDEAGRGALAGPVVAGAVIVAPECADGRLWSLVRDSKLISPTQREALFCEIQLHAKAWAVGVLSAAEIDTLGIAAATRLAMQQAITSLAPCPDHLLIDWVRLPQTPIPQLSRPKADRTMVSVAAASIIAKVHRDRLMVEQDSHFPHYGFAAHKGYGVAAHLAAIEHYGPCPLHRHSFAPIAHHPTLFEAHDHR
jgi:ribonuclease HII